MIHPNMCTMLSFVATDANISKEMLQKSTERSRAGHTYNMVSVDADTSQTIPFSLLANGLAGNPEITEENDYKIFKEALGSHRLPGDAYPGDGEAQPSVRDDSGREQKRAGRDTAQKSGHHIESDESGNLRHDAN